MFVKGRVGQEGEYLGRAAKGFPKGNALANPFYMKDESYRDEVCDKYKEWFLERVSQKDQAVMAELRRLWMVHKQHGGDISLLCYCSPKRCHVDTVVQWLNSFLKGDI